MTRLGDLMPKNSATSPRQVDIIAVLRVPSSETVRDGLFSERKQSSVVW